MTNQTRLFALAARRRDGRRGLVRSVAAPPAAAATGVVVFVLFLFVVVDLGLEELPPRRVLGADLGARSEMFETRTHGGVSGL